MVINKLVVTDEAMFDYEECLKLGTFPHELKGETEMYIDNMNRCGKLVYNNYFIAKYFDESNNVMLLLFIYRADKFGLMQTWQLKGICEEKDWSEEFELTGAVRNWLNSKITDLYDYDWVVRLRSIEVFESNIVYSIKGIREKAKNEFLYSRDKELVEELPFLQSASRKRNIGRKNKTKNRVPRKKH